MLKMPQNTVLCRICLAIDKRMCNIADTPLQAVYEKITDTPLNTADLRPVVVCYICFAQLKKCLKLMLTSDKTENMLTRILERHPNAIKSSKKLITLVKRKTSLIYESLSTTPVDCTDVLSFMAPIVVKTEQEYVQHIVKMEMNCDQSEEEKSLSSEFPEEPHLGSDLDIDKCELDLKDSVVLENIRMEQECYRYNVKVEPLEEECWQGPNITVPEKPSHIQYKKNEKECNSEDGESQDRCFECDVCRRQFRRKCHLETHMFVHTDEKPFQCTFCQRRFKLKHGLERHTRTHTGEKPFACDHCPRRFIEKSVMKIHLRTHTGEKPYSCEVCERRFKQLCDMKRHARIHTGEKPFKCKICLRRFNEKSKVARHAKRHFGEKLTKRNFDKLFKDF